MQSFGSLPDSLSPLVTLWEWSPTIGTLAATIILCFFYLKWWPGWKAIRDCPRPFIIVPIVATVAVSVPIYAFSQFMDFLNKVPISIECHRAPGAIVMPPGGVIYQLSLWALPAESGGGGFGEITGPSVGKEMELSSPPNSNPPYRCQIINHGNTPIFSVDMALHLVFKAAMKDGQNPSQTNSGNITLIRDWPIHIPKIDVGTNGVFEFYVSNFSQQFVFVSLPSSATWQRPYGNRRETSSIMQPLNFTMYFAP